MNYYVRNIETKYHESVIEKFKMDLEIQAYDGNADFVQKIIDYAFKFHADDHEKFVPKTRAIFEVMFVIFTKFCQNEYNGIVRQLMKLFLDKLEIQIKKILNLNIEN